MLNCRARHPECREPGPGRGQYRQPLQSSTSDLPERERPASGRNRTRRAQNDWDPGSDQGWPGYRFHTPSSSSRLRDRRVRTVQWVQEVQQYREHNSQHG